MKSRSSQSPTPSATSLRNARKGPRRAGPSASQVASQMSGSVLMAAPWRRDLLAALIGGATLGLVVLFSLRGSLFAPPPAENAQGNQAPVVSAGPGPAPSRTPAPREGIPLASGPWGNLRASALWLAPLPAAVRPEECATLQPWILRGRDLRGARALLSEAQIPAAQQEALLSHSRCDAAGCTLNPSASDREALPAASRAILYPILAQDAKNQVQANAFRFERTQVQPWLRASDLADPLKTRVQRLLFPQGQAFTFADQDTLCSQLAPAEQSAVLRAVSMTPAELVTLDIAAGQGVDALVDYYGGGGREEQVRPVLVGLSRRPGGGSMDLSELLPAFVRERLYRYPDAKDPPSNCHHSALNFFATTPEPATREDAVVRRTISEHYQPLAAGEPPRLGDLLTLERSDGWVMHSMAYIAADIVFTKNGHWIHAPWVLTRLRDVLALYQDGTVTEHRYRIRP